MAECTMRQRASGIWQLLRLRHWQFPIFLGLGVLEDLLSGAWTKCIAESNLLAVPITMAITFVAIFVLSKILLEKETWKSLRLWAYILGNALGTVIVVEF